MAYLLLSKSDFENPNLSKMAEHWDEESPSVVEALGCVAWTLHNAQDAEIETCDREALLKLMPPYNNKEAVMEDLIRFGFIVAIDSTHYRIEGMKRQITSVRRSRGGKSKPHVDAERLDEVTKSKRIATHSRRERRHLIASAATPEMSSLTNNPKLNERDLESKTELEGNSEPPSASLLEIKYTIPDGSPVNQQSEILSDVDQLEIPDAGYCETQLAETKKRKMKAPKVVSAEEARRKMPTPFVWNAYKDAYVARYGHEPLRDAKVNSVIRRLVERLGLQRAEAVVAYYVNRDDAFYVNAAHDLGICLLDAQKLLINMQSGSVTTMESAKRIERASENDRAVRNYLNSDATGVHDESDSIPK